MLTKVWIMLLPLKCASTGQPVTSRLLYRWWAFSLANVSPMLGEAAALAPKLDVDASALKAGDAVTITVADLKPGSVATFTLNPGNLAWGSAVVDSKVVVILVAIIPAASLLGEYTLKVTGTNAAEQTGTGVLWLFVMESTAEPTEKPSEQPTAAPRADSSNE